MTPAQASPTTRPRLGRSLLVCATLALFLVLACGPGEQATSPSTKPDETEAPSATTAVPTPTQSGDALEFAKKNAKLIALTLRLPEESTIEMFSAEPVMDGAIDRIEFKLTRKKDKQPLYVKAYLSRDRKHILLGEIFEIGTPGRVRINPDWIPIEGAPIEGDPDAPVTIVEFGDFECAFCAEQNKSLSKLMGEYEGKVRLVYKYFTISNHFWATSAYVGAECARKQKPETFFEFRDYFYANQADVTTTNVRSKALELAADLDLDLNKFKSCFDENNKPDAARETQFEGYSVSVDKIPTFFINGEKREGMQDYASLKDSVDQALRDAGVELPVAPVEDPAVQALSEEEGASPAGSVSEDAPGEQEASAPAAPEEGGAAASAGTDPAKGAALEAPDAGSTAEPAGD